ncbi:lipopolysaccharide biosynthesis protein [Prolixibacter denitrificans]|uniref:O-antigen/teichoic acid export membrane protein n=1 Tax=Prolixibacter denitrificans TaxID=1541063 RepID=A0A2P8CE01_9BACT|nr:polysaccharide biosynthesis C-terminal domain-containing protein [Prolixibacter denitrificans]PSK83129.1 O-antigen/teichoic acid export membrane protein [Prolixibacter denitrificans]GET21988.1 hypothetical protein JCM18694_22340 [Prolixibacter denitrificans]
MVIASVHVKSLRQNVAWMFVGNGFYAFCQWLVLSLISKWTNIQELGYFTLSLAIAAPVYMFMNFQLRPVLITDAEKRWEFSEFFTMRTVSTATGFLLVLLIGFFFGKGNFLRILLLISAIKAIEALTDIIHARLQKEESMSMIARSLMLKGSGYVVSVIIGLLIFKSLVSGLALYFLLCIGFIYFVDYHFLKLVAGKIKMLSKSITKSILIIGFPLAVVRLIIALNSNVAKYIAEINLGTEKQAIYSTLAYLIVMGDVFIQAIGQTFIPRINKYAMNNNWKAVKRLKFYFSIICIVTGLALYMASISAGGMILRVLFSAEIAQYQHLFSLLMLSGILIYYSSSAGQTLTALKIFKPQPWIHVITFTVNIIAILILVNRLGLVGIIYATMIAFTVRIILSEWLLYRHLYLKQSKNN